VTHAPANGTSCPVLRHAAGSGPSCPANEASDTLIPVQVASRICDACPSACGPSCPANKTSDNQIPVHVASDICVAKKTPKRIVPPMTTPLDTTDKCLDPRPLRPMTTLAPLHPGTHPRRTTRTKGTNVRTDLHPSPAQDNQRQPGQEGLESASGLQTSARWRTGPARVGREDRSRKRFDANSPRRCGPEKVTDRNAG